MHSFEDHHQDSLEFDGTDALVARLRRMKWPEVSPELKQRCWEEFSQKISLRLANGPDDAAPFHGGSMHRHEYSRLNRAASGASRRAAIARTWAQRSEARVALSLR
jgi:hypothetical protein